MKKQSPLHHKISLFILTLLFLSPAFLQGCDGLMGSNESESEDLYTEGPMREEAPVSSKSDKFRFPGLLDQARTTSKQAGKNGASDNVHLYLAFNMYEANGVTPRILNKYDVTRRILNQYGITRRILDKYDVTRRILNQYGITRRILNQYDVTRRILNQYGLVTRYGGVITEAMLAEVNLTPAQLQEAGVSGADLEDFNTFSALLNEYGLTPELFEEEMANFVNQIRLKVRIKDAKPGITIAMPFDLLDVFLEEISDDPDILFVEPDAKMDIGDLLLRNGFKHQNQMIPWNTSRVGGVFTKFNSDSEVHVFVLDSGIYDRDLNLIEKKDFTMLFINRNEDTWDDTGYIDREVFDPGNEGNPEDGSGHGSHIAGIIGAKNNDKGIKGMAPDVKLHSLKVLTDEGTTDITTVVAAIDYVTDWKQRHPLTPVVMNMSLGMDLETTAYNVLDEAVKNAAQFGISVVVSAGNDAMSASTYSPAHVAEAITVGSYDQEGTFSSFSNFGPSVDLLAPGEMVISLTHLEEEADLHENVLMSGTSNATPHVTAAAALYLHQNPSATPAQVKQALINYAQASIEGAPAATTNKTVYVAGFAEDGETKPFTFTKVEWKSGDQALVFEGAGPRLDTVTMTSDATGEELGTATVDEFGVWKLIIANQSKTPCSVTATYNGYQLPSSSARMEVDNAPATCESTFQFTKASWKEDKGRLIIQGRGPYGLNVTLTSLLTGEEIATVTIDNQGNFTFDKSNLSIRACIVSARLDNGTMIDHPVSKPPSECAGAALPVIIDKASYDELGSQLKVEGRAAPGSQITFYSPVSGNAFATAEVDDIGQFRLEESNPAIIPCIVRAMGEDGSSDDKPVSASGTYAAPSLCERTLEIESVKWLEQELEIKGRGIFDGALTIYDARTGVILHIATMDQMGMINENIRNLPFIPCAVTLESQEATLVSVTMNIENKPFNCVTDLTMHTFNWLSDQNVLSIGGAATPDSDVTLINPDNGTPFWTTRTDLNGVWRADLNLSFSGNLPPCRVRATAESGDVIEQNVNTPSCNTSFTYTDAEEEREQNAHSFVTLSKAKWEASNNRLIFEGEGYVLSNVTITNPVTGEVLGQTMTDDQEDWILEIYDPATVPCSVSVELDGRRADRDVDNAPGSCSN